MLKLAKGIGEAIALYTVSKIICDSIGKLIKG